MLLSHAKKKKKNRAQHPPFGGTETGPEIEEASLQLRVSLTVFRMAGFTPGKVKRLLAVFPQ